ncbi:ATP-binding protein [Streptacidiphilus sp. EB103A]|uniref:ATP-binding protein n=1 Tax=Streptacidiphilus sp. EB103A TaxID=3156275 RepID=UPI00351305F2
MPAHQIRFLIPRRPRLVAITRNRVAAQVRAWGTVLDQETADTLDLLVSELVTNAVLHTRSLLITVGVQLERGRLRIEVDDDSTAPPTGTASDPLDAWQDESGRGVHLIAELAAGHGWEPLHRGKRVWFELVVAEPTRTRARAALLRRAARAVRRSPRWPIAARSVIRRGSVAVPLRPRPDPADALIARRADGSPVRSLTCGDRIRRMLGSQGPIAA